MLDSEITLCLYEFIKDSNDQEIMTLVKETPVFAKEESLSNAFYFKSTAEGHRLSTSYLVHPFEYSGEQRVKAHGKLLKVERVRPVTKYDLDLLEIMVGELDG
jgi:SPP1 family predicted phage head-tail adaptor